MFNRIGTIPGKIVRQIQLLKRDPEQAGRNLLQFTDPALFEARLLDVSEQPPLHVVVRAGRTPTLNVLQPVLEPSAMTGGPNTILTLSALVAEQGLPVCIVTNRLNHRPELEWFARHVSRLLGRQAPKELTFDVASDPKHPAFIGERDIWLATHWTTAQGLKLVLPHMRSSWFIYFVQDFEPGFYPWSSNYALALETYNMNFRGVINETFLAKFMRAQRIGRFSKPEFLERYCRVFEPAVDRRVFYPPIKNRRELKRILLLYARPTNQRNLLGLAVQALRQAISTGAMGPEWRFLAIGSRNSLPPIKLGGGHILEPVEWSTYTDYADTLRRAEILFCPMLSPHTSYPVIEMAACGGRVITNAYGPKTPEALAKLAPTIRGVRPTVEDFVRALSQASTEPYLGDRADCLSLPKTWDIALGPTAQWIVGLIQGETPP